MASRISGFQITRADEGYLLTLETDDGPAVELTASYEQLDLIAEAIDTQLDRDEEDVLGVDTQDD